MTTPYKLLVVDDDQRLRELLEKYLSEQGYQVHTAENAEHANHLLQEHNFDLMVLDVMMPGASGIEFTQSLRKKDNPLPILLLTAMGETDDRIKGLESGADDYMGKPFAPKELLLRIQKILHRTKAQRKPTSHVIEFGSLKYSLSNKSLYREENPIHLTSTESELLYHLISNSGSPLSRDDLSHMFGIVISPRTIDVQITRLRKKIEEDPKKPTFIKTVRHKGYVFSKG